MVLAVYEEFIDEHIIADVRCDCGSGTPTMRECGITEVEGKPYHYDCEVECWDCPNIWVVRVEISPLVKIVGSHQREDVE